MLPGEIKNCLSIKGAFERLIKRTNSVMNPKEFLKNIIFNIIFHSIDIASAIAYAIEDGMDDGYYEMGFEAGNALNIFLFNDTPQKGDEPTPDII